MKLFGRRILGKGGLSRFLQWRFNTTLVRWFPLAVSRWYLNMLGKLYFFLNTGDREKIERSLWTVLSPTRPAPELASVFKRTIQGVFSHYFEKLFIAYTKFEKTCRFLNERVTVDGSHLLDEALSQGRGVILVTGHYGAVEFLPLTLALKGYPVTMLLRFKTRQLKETLNRRAENVPITLVDAAEEENVIFTALKALRRNQILITECDEFECWKPHRTEGARFLGSDVLLDRSLDMLHGRSKAPVVMGLVRREEENRFGLKLHALDTERRKSRPLGIARQALSILEDYIYQSPDQWYQWKEADFVLKNIPKEPVRPIRANQTDRRPPVTDTPAYAYSA